MKNKLQDFLNGGLNTLNITVRYVDFNDRLLNYIALAAYDMQNNSRNNLAAWWDIHFYSLQDQMGHQGSSLYFSHASQLVKNYHHLHPIHWHVTVPLF